MVKINIIPSKTCVSMPAHTTPPTLRKRQEKPTESVVHVTVTAAGTVVYTQTATSYSYIQSYSTIHPSGTFLPGNQGHSGDTELSSSHTNTGAIIGGVIGGVAGVALIGLAYFLYTRSQRRKKEQRNNQNDPHDYHYSDANQRQTMTSQSPTPRHFIAPLEQIGKHELVNGADTKCNYHGNGYYEDIMTPYPTAYYSTEQSVTSDSLPSTTIDTTLPYSKSGRHVPDEIDYPQEERHVPNTKEDRIIIEPPHTKD